MPKFPKSSGFSQGGNPFTMNQGSKEIHTEGSFSKKSSDKMDSYGSPLFAIAQGARSTGLYSDADPSQGREGIEDAISSGLDKEKKQEDTKTKKDGLEIAEENVANEDDMGTGDQGKTLPTTSNEALKPTEGPVTVGLEDDTIPTP